MGDYIFFKKFSMPVSHWLEKYRRHFADVKKKIAVKDI